MLNVFYAECRKETHNAECHYAECCYAECRYAECHGSKKPSYCVFQASLQVIQAHPISFKC